jgi:DNA-binding transcriptional ArsR family regulator
MAKLVDFMISKVRVKMLELFFRNPHELWYVRQLTRELDEEINAVRRELTRLSKIGLLKSEQRGNRLYYFLNQAYTFYPELLRLTAKSSGLGLALRQHREVIGNPRFIMFSSQFTQHKKRRADEVDILFVGEMKTQALEPMLKAEEALRKHEINYTVMTGDEFDFRKQRRDPFVLEILSGGRIMIVGDEDALVERKPEMP